MMPNRAITWLAEEHLDGRRTARLGRSGDTLVAEFPGLGTIVASIDGTSGELHPAKGANPVALRKLGASAIDALMRHLRGKLTFHGGAVSEGSRVIAFVGASGSGKSTLAAAACINGGFDLVADDTVSIEFPQNSGAGRLEVVPSQSSAWLLPTARDSLGLSSAEPGKVAVALGGPASTALALVAVLGLQFDDSLDEPVLERVRGQEAFAMLCQSTIRFLMDRPEAQLREFSQLQLVVEQCPIYRLRRSRKVDSLERSVVVLQRLFTDSARAW